MRLSNGEVTNVKHRASLEFFGAHSNCDTSDDTLLITAVTCHVLCHFGAITVDVFDVLMTSLTP